MVLHRAVIVLTLKNLLAGHIKKANVYFSCRFFLWWVGDVVLLLFEGWGFWRTGLHRSVWYGECFVDPEFLSWAERAERIDLGNEAAGEIVQSWGLSWEKAERAEAGAMMTRAWGSDTGCVGGCPLEASLW